MKINTNVLVTGVGGLAGIAAMQMLKARGFHVIAVDMAPVNHCADAFFLVPPVYHPAFFPQLDALLQKHHIGWLFPTVQEELVPLAQRAALYRQRGITVFVAAAEAVAICDDKWHTARILAQAGVAVPRSAIGDSDSATVMELGFPRVSKPRVGRGGRNVAVHDAIESVPAASEGAGLVWQAFMPGTEYDVLMMIPPEQPQDVTVVVFEKTALREGRTGNALNVVRTSAPDVRQLALCAANALKMTGPLDMDIRRDRNGIAHVLEVNARIGAHTRKAPEIFEAMIALYALGSLGG